MGLNEILLVCAALLPAVALCIYVFRMDRAEKEPVGLLLLLLFSGCVICYPAAEIEGALIGGIQAVFGSFGTAMPDGTVVLDSPLYEIYVAVENFIGVALVEEGLKFAVLYFVTRHNKNFNSLFDGIIYSVFVSLGFAALENVMYVTQYGWMNAIMRGILSVPGHMFFGVLMGYYYTMWHMFLKSRNLERQCKMQGLIPMGQAEFETTRYLVLAVVMPVLAHGWYDFCCSMDSGWMTLILYVFVGFLYFYCFGKIRKMSNADTSDALFSTVLLYKKYPYLAELARRQWEEEQARKAAAADWDANSQYTPTAR